MFLTDKNKYLYLGLLVGLIIVATIISSGYSRDSLSYIGTFNYFGRSGWDGLGNDIFYRELFYLIVSKSLYQFGLSAFYLFLIYAILSLTVKFHLINQHSKDKWLSLAFYVSYFFILHDSTQIRFGLAIAFVYLALHFLADNRKFLFLVIVLFSAIMFHIISLVFVVMLLFTSSKSLWWLFGLVAGSVILYPVDLNAVLLSSIENAVNYFEVQGTFLNDLYFYLKNPSADIFLGMFSRSAMLVYLCAIVIFQYRDKFSTYELLCYNAFILSIFFYILLKDSVDLQVRIRDLFGFSLVFLMPFILRGMSVYIGSRNAYIILYLYLGVHLIKFAIYDKMLIL
jgi:hypothetical protein